MEPKLTRPLRVAFAGPSGAGKTTCALFTQRLMHPSVIISVAAPVKRVVQSIHRELGAFHAETESQDNALQVLIRDILVERDPSILQRHFVECVNRFSDRHIVNDDFRSPMLATMKDLGFLTVWVSGSHADMRHDDSKAQGTLGVNDATVARSDCDAEIDNSGPVEGIFPQLRQILEARPAFVS